LTSTNKSVVFDLTTWYHWYSLLYFSHTTGMNHLKIYIFDWLICDWVRYLSVPMHLGLSWWTLCATYPFMGALLLFWSSRWPPGLTLLMSSFKYNQQDATLYNILYYCQCCTCFRQFLHPSSGAQNCKHSIWYMPCLLAATAGMGELEPTHASCSSQQAWHIPDAVCTVLSSWW